MITKIDWPSTITLGFFSLAFFVIVGLSMFIFGVGIKNWATKQLFKCKQHLKFILDKYLLLYRVSSSTKNALTSISINMVFQAFVHCYEANSKDIENWALPTDMFPNGINDLMFLYKWIKKIRPQNYTELQTICQYDYEKSKVDYWGAYYQGFKFKIDSYGELKISPLKAVDAINPDTIFERTLLKLQNAIYNMDTQKCTWILERRKFLGI